MKNTQLNVGLLGAGRLGRLYARILATSIPRCRLVAIADTQAAVARSVAEDFGVGRWEADPMEVIEDNAVDAVVIVTPTRTHRAQIEASARAGKAIFAEKPVCLNLEDARAVRETVEKSGVFFHMGLMRRFDPGYAAAKKRIEAGEIGRPVLFKATSRDPFLPSLDYLAPESSGGLYIDMGIHDFDLALWLMGRIERVHALGGVLAYPQVKPLGDVDNGVVSLNFAGGPLGCVDLSRNGVYGYDISTEILGTEGTLRVGYIRETPILVMKKEGISHDTVPYFMERFGTAYFRQLEAFVTAVVDDHPPSITLDEGIEALRVSVAATRSLHEDRSVRVEEVQ